MNEYELDYNRIRKSKKPKRKSPPVKYTPDQIKQEALKYEYRSDWSKNSPNTYCYAIRRSKLFEECTSHMKYKVSCFTADIGTIYAFIFDDKTAYIGLSIEAPTRYINHQKRGTVFDKIQTGVTWKYVILEDNISNKKLSDREIFYTKQFENGGYILLNKNKAGSRGSIKVNWTDEEIYQKAIKYTTRTGWLNGHQSTYYAAKDRNIFDECCVHMKRCKNFKSEDQIYEIAQQYTSIKDWRKCDMSSYRAARQKRILKECTAHMTRLHEKWTKQKILESAKKYNTRNEWKKGHYAAYQAAYLHKVEKECFEHMQPPPKKWTVEEIKHHALKFTSRTSWYKGHKNSYQSAYNKGVLDECCQHMINK